MTGGNEGLDSMFANMSRLTTVSFTCQQNGTRGADEIVQLG